MPGGAHRRARQARTRQTRRRLETALVAALLAFGCGASTGNDAASGGGATGSSTSGSGASGGGTGGAAPTGGPGVVSEGMCVRLCVDASTDPDGDGWGYEYDASCIVPGSYENTTRIACVVGDAVPTQVGPPAGSPGVVVENECVGLCVAAIDDDGDGWGWEFEHTCVMAGSVTAMASLACETAGEIPVVDLTGSPGRLIDERCVPFCATEGSDPEGDGYGYEFGQDCLVSGGVPATTLGIDCLIGEDATLPPVTLNPSPPPGQLQKPAEVASTGFFVQGGKLYDKFGNEFVMRGVNNPHIWFDTSNQWLAYHALEDIAGFGVNTVRIVWQTNGSAANLARVIRRIVELRMVPMVEMHDVTGGTTNESLLLMSTYLAREDVKQVLLAYEDFLLVNIANEWSGSDFTAAYSAAISRLRTAGIDHTLVIDSNGFGQNAETILNEGAALTAADPQHNVLFSVHMYDEYSTDADGPARVTALLEQAAAAQLPLIIGEFGWQSPNGAAIDVAHILSESVRLGVGYLAWSWHGNDVDLAFLDMVDAWGGALTTWGSDVIESSNGVTATAAAASIFTL